MSENNDELNLSGEFDELDNRIILNDEDGNEIEFEFLDVVEVDEKEYVVLLPVEEAEKGEVVIFRIEGEGEEESYISLDDEAEAERVFEAFIISSAFSFASRRVFVKPLP